MTASSAGQDRKEENSPIRLQILTNSVWNLAAFLIATVVGIVSVPLYIHYLGMGRYGLMVLLNSILVPMGLLDLGFGKATIKYVAESVARHDFNEAGTYVRTTLLFNIGIGIVGMVLIAALTPLLTTRIFKIDPPDLQLAQSGFYWIAFGWLVTQIVNTYQNIPAAFQRYSIVAIGTSLSLSLGILLGLLALALGGSLLTMIQVRVLWTSITIIGWLWIACKLLPGISLRPAWHKLAFRRSFSFGIWQTVSNVGSMLAGQTDRFFLGAYFGTATIGLYNIAYTIQITVYNAIYRLGEVLFPAMSGLHGSGQEERAGRLMLRTGWFLSSVTILAMSPLVIFAHDILRLYVGLTIADSVSWLLRLFAVAAMMTSGSVSVFQYIMGTGRTQWLAISTLASGVVILIGGIVLIPAWGLMGAGWTQLAAVLFSRPLVLFFFWRALLRRKVALKVYASYLYGPAVTGAATSLLLSILRQQFIWVPGWISLASAALAGGLVTLCVTWAVSLLLPEGHERQADLASLWQVLLIRVRVRNA